MAGQLRVDEISNEAGTGAPSFPNKITPSSLGTGTPSSSNFLRGDGAWSIVDNATNATNATNLTGTSTSNIQTSALASGTANSTTFLRGDRTWQTIETTPTTAQVLAATAGAEVGAVGTYAFLGETSDTDTVAGSTKAGSGLRYAGVQKSDTTAAAASWGANNTFNGSASALVSVGSIGAAPAGTWRAMGTMASGTTTPTYVTIFLRPATLWLRIS
jgi:hypothetical protein